MVLIGLFLLIIGINMMTKTEKGKRYLTILPLKFPIVSDVVWAIMTTRLSRVLSTLLSSGVLLLESLQITKRVYNSILTERMERIHRKCKRDGL